MARVAIGVAGGGGPIVLQTDGQLQTDMGQMGVRQLRDYVQDHRDGWFTARTTVEIPARREWGEAEQLEMQIFVPNLWVTYVAEEVADE